MQFLIEILAIHKLFRKAKSKPITMHINSLSHDDLLDFIVLNNEKFFPCSLLHSDPRHSPGEKLPRRRSCHAV